MIWKKQFAEISSWAVSIAKFGSLREPMRILPFIADQFSQADKQKLHISPLNNSVYFTVAELLLPEKRLTRKPALKIWYRMSSYGGIR